MTDNVKAIVLALIASFSGVVMNVFLKISLEDINVFTSGFLRFFFGLILKIKLGVQYLCKCYLI